MSWHLSVKIDGVFSPLGWIRVHVQPYRRNRSTYKAFSEAEWLLSLIVIIVLPVVILVIVTLVIESMSRQCSHQDEETTQAKIDEERDVDNVSESYRLLENN